jgi:LDH2 family malate/lactate/ureidoglycolate dehydrogenase
VAPDYDRVRIAGEPELEKRQERAQAIAIEAATWADLCRSAQQVGMSEADIASHTRAARFC